MKKDKIKPLPIVKAYADYFVRRAKRILKLKESDYNNINIDFYGRSGMICVWIHGKDSIIARVEFESDGKIRDKYDYRQLRKKIKEKPEDTASYASLRR